MRAIQWSAGVRTRALVVRPLRTRRSRAAAGEDTRPPLSRVNPRQAQPLLPTLTMSQPPEEHHVERKVVYENVSTTSTKNSAVAWVIIGLLAVGLVVFILMRMN